MLVAVATAACAEGGATARNTVVRDSAGIAIVESTGPAWGPEQALALAPEPALLVGDEERGPEYQFGRVSAAVRLSDGMVRNAYTVKLCNMEARPRPMAVTVEGLPGARLWTDGMTREQALPAIAATVPADSVAKLRLFVALPGEGPQRQDFRADEMLETKQWRQHRRR